MNKTSLQTTSLLWTSHRAMASVEICGNLPVFTLRSEQYNSDDKGVSPLG